MPALPNVPNVLRIQLGYSIGSDVTNLSNLFWRYSGTPPNNSVLSTFATTLAAVWGSDMAGMCDTTRHLTSVAITDLTTPTSGNVAVTASVAGTRTGPPMTANTCALVNYTVARRYRGGKPRNYLPCGVFSDEATPQTWQSSFITSLTTNWGNFLSYIVANPPSGVSTMQHVNVSYYSGFTVFTTPSGRAKNIPTLRPSPLVDSITGFVVNPKFGSQRRRVNA